MLDDRKAKLKALKILMAQYSDKEYAFPDDVVTKTAIIKVVITRITGKHT
jgi:hypothetical protein